MSAIRNLEPQPIWKHFADLNAIPRPSKQEERVTKFVRKFGENLGLPTQVDEAGNVIIKKPATPGMEKCTTVVLQSHLDMVHQKNADTDFDFQTQGIQMYIDGDWVKAKGTTLGADNGIGVATIMALLADKDIPHPPLEALFTIDEETGMTGAMALKGGLLEGKILLNLDTEEDKELTIGCTGGIDVTAEGKYNTEKYTSKGNVYKISIKGLTGGHSGTDIHLGRGNANKLMNRFLYGATDAFNLRIHAIDGGGLRNAIPRESFAIVVVEERDVPEFQAMAAEFEKTLKAEYHSTDPGLQLTIEAHQSVPTVLPVEFQLQLLRSVYACPNGIYRMSPEIKDLVQTSNNLARVVVYYC